jgi:hypothetical protein
MIMPTFDQFPQYLLKQFIIEEKHDEDGNRLFLIKKRDRSFIWKKKYNTDKIPHKYQQNNSLEEAHTSITRYLTEVLGVHPEVHQHHSRSFWKKVFLLNFR